MKGKELGAIQGINVVGIANSRGASGRVEPRQRSDDDTALLLLGG